MKSPPVLVSDIFLGSSWGMLIVVVIIILATTCSTHEMKYMYALRIKMGKKKFLPEAWSISLY